MLARDPVVILHACADEVEGTRGAYIMRILALRLSKGLEILSGVMAQLLAWSELHTMFDENERAAMLLAREELAR